MTKLISTNPAHNYELVGEVDISSNKEISEKVALANKAKLTWKELGIKSRIELLKPICAQFKQKSAEIALLITQEMGKPIAQSKEEVDCAIEEFEWFLNNAEICLQDEITHSDNASLHKIVYEPFGTAAVITPWNYPFEMAVWGIVPNLIVGNTVVFKISEECPLVGKLIEEVFAQSSLPNGVFSEVYGAGDVGKRLASSKINLIWFTGSSRVGKELYRTAARKFIPAVLEMGGSNPCLVFEDADISVAVSKIYGGRYSNCGQICDAVKRLIVHESVHDEVISKLKQLVESKLVGDPSKSETDIGSLVAKRQLVALQEQVKDAVEKGAKIVTGGNVLSNQSGAFFLPTILTNITKDMRIWKEEVFGPVLPVVKFKTEQQAIKLANDTIYGLGSKVISADVVRANRVASKIEAGTVEINNCSRWLSCNPFGGYKLSGMGREHGIVGFRQLCQIKVVCSGK